MPLVAALACVMIAGCGKDYRWLEVDAGPANDLRLASALQSLATDGPFDAETATLASLSLEYTPRGVMRRARFQNWTTESQFMEVNYAENALPGEKRVRLSGSLSGPDPVNAAIFRDRYPLAAPVFRALDLVDPMSMIALMPPAGNLGFFTITSAYEFDGPQRASAPAYRWDGGRFVELPADHDLRQYTAGYAYLAGYSSKLVSSSSADGMASSTYQSSDFVYFVIPTPAD